MAGHGPFIAIDWGTTNRRAYHIVDGAVMASLGDGPGILAMTRDAYPAEIARLRATLGDLPVVAAGMVGSNRGWHDIPYIDAPATLTALAAASRTVARDMHIVPGVALRDGTRADVMRGEEVQVLGAIESGTAPRDALFCQPGTHNKWIATTNGAITDFATAMTGELFALLRQHGILAGMLGGEVADGPAFRDGVARGLGARDLTVALFEVRASVLLGIRPAADAAAYASGVLIGADVGAREDIAARPVHLLASGALAKLYAAAIGLAGGSTVAIDSHAAFVAGIDAIWNRI